MRASKRSVRISFGFLKGGQALVEHVGLSGVGQRRVGDHTVGLAVLVQVVLVDLDGALRRGDGVGDALGDDVEAQNGQHDHDAGEQRLPPTAGQHAVAGVGQDVAPGGGGLGDAGADEGQGGLEHDGVCHEHDGEHEDGSHAVAHDVLPQDPRGAGAGDDDCADVVLVVLAHDVGAHDAGDLRDVQKADGEDERRHGVAEHHDEGGGKRDAGEGHDDVQDTHDDVGDARAHDGGDSADDGAHDQREAGSA